MPQPLKKVNARAGLNYGQAKAITERPELALLAMSVIARWSEVESFAAAFFVALLGANPIPGAAVYATLTSNGMQKEALRAAADVQLDEPRRDVLEAILHRYSSAVLERNKIAHGLWAYSPEIPDGILLVKPRSIIAFNAIWNHYEQSFAQDANTDAQFPRFPEDEVLVYYERDFRQLLEQHERIIVLLGKLRLSLSQPGGPDKSAALQELLGEPEVLERLRRKQ